MYYIITIIKLKKLYNYSNFKVTKAEIFILKEFFLLKEFIC